MPLSLTPEQTLCGTCVFSADWLPLEFLVLSASCVPSLLQTLLHQASTRKLKKDRKKEIRQLEDKVCVCVSL